MNGQNEVGIKVMVAESGLSENYVRKMIRAGKIPTRMGTAGDTRIPKRYIDRADWDAWRESTVAHTKRDDGRNKFVMYMTADEEQKVRELLAGMEVEQTIVRANKKVVDEE